MNQYALSPANGSCIDGVVSLNGTSAGQSRFGHALRDKSDHSDGLSSDDPFCITQSQQCWLGIGDHSYDESSDPS